MAQPLEQPAAPAMDVQLRLTEEAANRVSLRAARPVQSVSGRVLSTDADSLVLSVRWGEIAGGSSGRPGPDVITLAHTDIEEIQRPQFSLSRTMIMLGAVAVVAAAILGVTAGSGSGNPDDGDPGGGGPPDNN